MTYHFLYSWELLIDNKYIIAVLDLLYANNSLYLT